jgi:hypothetical protein
MVLKKKPMAKGKKSCLIFVSLSVSLLVSVSPFVSSSLHSNHLVFGLDVGFGGN